MAIFQVTKSFYERRTETYLVDTDKMTEGQLKAFVNLSSEFETDDREGDAELEGILQGHDQATVDSGMADEPSIEYEIERADWA